MSEVRYEVHPRMFRMRPLSTLLTLFVMLGGILMVGLERYATATTIQGLLPGIDAASFPLIGVALFALGGIRLYAWYAPTSFERFTITDDCLIHTKGVLAKETLEINLDAVTEVQVEQRVWQRMLDIGTVRIYTDRKHAPLVLKGLPDPQRVRELLTGQAAA